MTARTNQSHSKTRNNFLVLFVSGKRCAWQATRLWLVYTKRFSVRNSPHTHTYIPFRRIQSACHVHGWWLMTTGTMCNATMKQLQLEANFRHFIDRTDDKTETMYKLAQNSCQSNFQLVVIFTHFYLNVALVSSFTHIYFSYFYAFAIYWNIFEHLLEFIHISGQLIWY